jgi:hypothetical protein
MAAAAFGGLLAGFVDAAVEVSEPIDAGPKRIDQGIHDPPRQNSVSSNRVLKPSQGCRIQRGSSNRIVAGESRDSAAQRAEGGAQRPKRLHLLAGLD